MATLSQTSRPSESSGLGRALTESERTISLQPKTSVATRGFQLRHPLPLSRSIRAQKKTTSTALSVLDMHTGASDQGDLPRA